MSACFSLKNFSTDPKPRQHLTPSHRSCYILDLTFSLILLHRICNTRLEDRLIGWSGVPHFDRIMSYRHDIFISYRRDPETYAWITEHFVPILKLRVEMELRRRPLVYVDDQIESGTWPVWLGLALGGSRVLVPLLGRVIIWRAFGAPRNSVTCSDASRKAKLRTVRRPHGVVIPAFIHDGEKFPADLRHIEHFEVQKCFNVRMARNSPRAEELDAALALHAPAIAACISNAPSWRKAWPKEASAGFFRQFHRRAETLQRTVLQVFTRP